MNRFGEFCGYLIVVAIAVLAVALSVAITYWSLTWAFGAR